MVNIVNYIKFTIKQWHLKQEGKKHDSRTIEYLPGVLVESIHGKQADCVLSFVKGLGTRTMRNTFIR